MTRSIILFFFLVISTTIFAQTKTMTKPMPSTFHQKWELGLSAGAMQYQGDLNSYGTKNLNKAVGGTVRYHVTDQFALRGNFLVGKLSGADSTTTSHPTRGLSFQAAVRELSFLGEIDIFGKRRFADGQFKKTLSPYLFGGVALSSVLPQTNYLKTPQTSEIAYNTDVNTDKKRAFLTIPLGVGLKYDLNKNWTFNAEAGLRLSFNDYLDGISQLANPDNMDTYAYGGIMVAYRIPYEPDSDGDGIKDANDKCPLFKGPKATMGCPDTDNDGVSDDKDACPNVAGLVTMNGCPDADEDGIEDSKDKCPNAKGDAKTYGCPDADEDGVSDLEDICPNQKGVTAKKGCPIVDTDNDGVEDEKDKCPTIKGDPESDGCPKDSDNDGVNDADDKCPNQAGKLNGCPDTDNDGVNDADDKCPNQAGKLNGCPDTDNDGFADADDKCPTSAGKINGCPDTDNDGVIDSEDRCPNQAGKIKGCPDSDNDGVNDADDKCPNQAGLVQMQGCPQVSEVDKKTLESAVYGVQFETGKATFKNSSTYDILNQVAEVLQRNAYYEIKISGHTDNVGTDKSNLELSESRAKACYNYLISKGVDVTRMSYAGYGKIRPVDTNDSNEGRAKNRRVEFELFVR